MKALTLRQPWASLVARRVKTIETRSWSTNYRGPLAIHAAKTWDTEWTGWKSRDDWHLEVLDNIDANLNEDVNTGEYYKVDRWTLPLGAVVATCTLARVMPMVAHPIAAGRDVPMPHLPLLGDAPLLSPAREQGPYGDFAIGRFAWFLTKVEPIEPVLVVGRQGLWEWSPNPGEA